MEKKILVTAAGGNQGKILIPKAAKAGFTVRAMRRPKDADELLAIGVSEVVIGGERHRRRNTKHASNGRSLCTDPSNTWA